VVIHLVTLSLSKTNLKQLLISKASIMKNFANLTLEVLSTEELLAIRGGDSPVDPIIIKDGPNYNSLRIKKNLR
jgi:hypothetical protein